MDSENNTPTETHVLAQGEIEIIEYGSKGTRGMTRIMPDDWWFKLPVGNYRITATPLDAPAPPQTRETGP